ncbi:MAG: diacylglycerol kinase family protein [Bacteroidetes bacterium]|nr:MAG: diacylglycerol kinase family protein [Bacteroidota bacterium]
MSKKTAKAFRLKDRIKSFGYAFKGIVHALQNEHNLMIHFTLAIAAIAFGFWLNINQTEWLFVIVAIGFVLVSELFNSAIEVLVDLVSPERNPKAGLIKDIAAGAVLISAITAAIIGLFIFIPKIINLCF